MTTTGTAGVTGDSATSMRIAEIIQRVYSAGTVAGRNGAAHRLRDSIDPEEGRFMVELIRGDPTITRTLEIGCAYGLSSLHICGAIEGRAGASHTIIDPFQSTDWDDVGRRHLEEAGVTFADFIETGSEFALPSLCERMAGRFDFVFVDGWHTFDHTLIDCFYATRLLRVGGYLAVDDTAFPSVRRAVDFVSTYPCYERYGSVRRPRRRSWARRVAARTLRLMPDRVSAVVLAPQLRRRAIEDHATDMIALKKVQEDHRPWNWHDDAF